MKKLLPLWIITTLSIILYLASMILAKIDTHFDYRWLTFSLHISSILILLITYIFSFNLKTHLKKLFNKNERNTIIFLISITGIVNLLMLSTYPYVSIVDELRDSGLDTMRIASGDIKNIFGYGNYNGYGLIIQIFTIPFYYIFGNNPLTYRSFAALLSSIDVLLLYLLIHQVVNKKTALWSAIILAALPLHIFFAHTQVIVAFNFFWVPIILLSFLHLLKHHKFIDYIFLGTIIGFVCGFHAAIRTFAILIFLLLLFLEFKDIILKKLHKEKTLTRLSKIALLISFIIIGFGPRLLFTTPHNLLDTNRFMLQNKLESNIPITTNDLTTIKDNYIKSLLGYNKEPVSFFYHDKKPIFTPFLSIFFIIGIIYSLFVLKNFFLNILLFILFTLPFLNSAITDYVNADHRFSPLFSIGSVFVAIGITCCLKLLKYKWLKYLLITILSLQLFYLAASFYTNQTANKEVNFQDNLSMHTLYFLQTYKQFQNSPSTNLKYANSTLQKIPICIHLSPGNYHYFNNNPGIDEQNKFLLPSANIQYTEAAQINYNEVYIINGNCSEGTNYTQANRTYKISCSPNNTNNTYKCPQNYNGDILIHY